MQTLRSILAATLVFGAAAHAQQPAATPSAAYKAVSPKLTRAQFDALLAQPENVLVIDVRRPDEVSAIGGFPAYLSIQAKDLERSTAYIPRDRTVVTVSNHAGRALRAADLLLKQGFKVAGAVGAQDYEAEGGSLTRIAAPAPKVAQSGVGAH